MAGSGYVCSSCGKVHEGLPTDWGFGLPDEVYGLSYLDRYRRSRANADLCTLDGQRFFVRGLLLVPFSHQEGQFGWGMWAEVPESVHAFYLDNFSNELAHGTVASGHLANRIPGLAQTLGLAVQLEFQGARSRPLLAFPESAAHELALDQREGIGADRHHRYLEYCGYFDERPA